ncbi:transposase [Roseomonas sp. 573]|uniref:Transposase n=1 Tax=Roseomonas haemaphysalidis TaxID=2768162 RepID=A0ABS3KXJ2_9PROT|nr:transposase [Roseomonas haemaphysalidis]
MGGGRALPTHAARTGRPWSWPMRLVVDGILYVLRTGCAWVHLPRDFPPSGPVLRWFLHLSRSGTFKRLAHTLTISDHERVGRDASPTAAVMDATIGWFAPRAMSRLPPHAPLRRGCAPELVKLMRPRQPNDSAGRDPSTIFVLAEVRSDREVEADIASLPEQATIPRHLHDEGHLLACSQVT